MKIDFLGPAVKYAKPGHNLSTVQCVFREYIAFLEPNIGSSNNVNGHLNFVVPSQVVSAASLNRPPHLTIAPQSAIFSTALVATFRLFHRKEA